MNDMGLDYALAVKARKEEKVFYDIDELSEILIQDICEKYNIEVKQRNGSMWCAVRDEKTPSCKIYTKTNSFCDFGNGNVGGNSIAFVAYIENCKKEDAIYKLAQLFGVMPINHYNFKNTFELSDIQLEKIHIYAPCATNNFNIDLSKYSDKQTLNFVKKYNMSVNELAKMYPEQYHNMLRDRAIPYVNSLRNNYYCECYYKDVFYKNCNLNILENSEYLLELELLKKKLEDCENILAMAITDKTLLKHIAKTYDVKKDIEQIRNGTLQFETGSISYVELKLQAKANNENLTFIKCSCDKYFDAVNSELSGTSYAAFIKGDLVNIAYRPSEKAVEKFAESLIQETTQTLKI